MKSEQENITLSNEERLAIIEDMIDKAQRSSRTPSMLLGFILALLSAVFFYSYTLFLGLFPAIDAFNIVLGLFFALASLKSFSIPKNNTKSKFFKNASSDIEKINEFIYYTNSQICGRKIENGALAMPLMLLGNKYSHTKWVVQPLLTIENIDTFLINGYANLITYQIPISIQEYSELERLLYSNVDEFNKEIIQREYIIKE